VEARRRQASDRVESRWRHAPVKRPAAALRSLTSVRGAHGARPTGGAPGPAAIFGSLRDRHRSGATADPSCALAIPQRWKNEAICLIELARLAISIFRLRSEDLAGDAGLITSPEQAFFYLIVIARLFQCRKS
jgi:hypothetical protein